MSFSFQDIIKEFYSDVSFDKSCDFLNKYQIKKLDMQTLSLIDKDLIKELKFISNNDDVLLYFGKTLRDIKLIIRDESGVREHEIFVYYKAPEELVISSVNLPYSPLHDKEYKTVTEICLAYTTYVNDLLPYFYELENIDERCTVMEPLNPTYKDNYRKILLDDRVWLHVEVTPTGMATNVHLVSHTEVWHDKLHAGLFSWDHDKDIVENIMLLFDITEFPRASKFISSTVEDKQTVEQSTCGICLCYELPDNVGLPQPLCQNTSCGAYFHRNCLYQWLVACSAGRLLVFGVASGACPMCLKPITCSEMDS